MPKLAIKRQGQVFVPATAAAQAEFEKFPAGAFLKADITRDRSGPAHRYYWAMCTLIAEALNAGPTSIYWTQELVSDRLKIATGRVEIIDLPPSLRRAHGATIGIKPVSISFAKMDGVEFYRFLESAIAYVVTEFGDWIIDHPNWTQVQDILSNSKVPA